MAGRSQIEMAKLNLRVPFGHDGFWKIILELDAQGSWTAADVDGLSRVNSGTVRDFIRRLLAGGIAEVVDARPARSSGGTAHSYRLLKRPIETPRLRRNGSELPELATETLWRSMKMLKSFTIKELVASASTDGREFQRSYVKRYLYDLAGAGVLARLNHEKGSVETRFRLLNNIGSKAPKILRAHIVFDPNANVVLGDAQATEVQP